MNSELRLPTEKERAAGLICARCSHVNRRVMDEVITFYYCMIKDNLPVSDVNTCNDFESNFGEHYD